MHLIELGFLGIELGTEVDQVALNNSNNNNNDLYNLLSLLCARCPIAHSTFIILCNLTTTILECIITTFTFHKESEVQKS